VGRYIHSITGTKQKVRRSIHKLDAQDMGTESWIVGVLKNISPTMIFLIPDRLGCACPSFLEESLLRAVSLWLSDLFLSKAEVSVQR
jgi:hypothetical protein